MLDLGCGTGLLLDLASIYPADYWGVDLSEGMLDFARTRHHGYRFFTGDMCDLQDIEDGAFDNVVCLWAFQYAMRPWDAVQEIHRCLKPCGQLWLLTNAPAHLKRGSGYLHDGAQVPQIKWDWRGLVALLRQFSDIQVRGLNAYADSLQGLPAPLLDLYLDAESVLVPKSKAMYLLIRATKERT